VGSESRRAFVLRAVKAAERVLELDAEDVTAHDLLAQCYAELGELPPAAKATTEEAVAQAGTAVDLKADRIARLQACGQVGWGVTTLPSPKLATIRELLGKFRPAFHADNDPEVLAALAGVLAVLHRESHSLYKPDEIARSNATRIYREKHPAANYAARERVIYPTTPGHRDAIVKTGNLP